MEISPYGTLKEFKDHYKYDYYGWNKENYPELTFVEYLDELNKMYIKLKWDNRRNYSNNKTPPDWIITTEELEFWKSCQEFENKLYIEYCDIIHFIGMQSQLEQGKILEQEILFKELIGKQKNTKATKLSAMARIELLNRIGFNELEFVKKLDSKQLKSLLTTVLNYAERDISGYVNSLTSTSNESKFFITDAHKEDVDKYLKDLL